MGRAARPLHDPGNHRSTERRSNLQAARRGGLMKPAKPAGERVNTAALTPSLGTRSFSDVGQRTLIYSEGMQNGSNLCLATMNVDCGPVDLQSPRNPLLSGQVFGDLGFPDFDDKNTGRPVRILIANNADPPVLWELGGYDSSRL